MHKHPFFEQDPKHFCLTLVGMPGAGKSTLAISLARALDWAFVDTDLLLQAWYGLPLEELRERLGNADFLQAEEQIVLGLWLQRCVIATGGSVIYSQQAIQKLKDIGQIIYLQAGYATISNRVSKYPQRGMILQPEQSLQDIYLERTPKYEAAADLILSTEENSLQQCIKKIKAWMHDKQLQP
ncbi:MAG: homoserine kinase [Desulfohalobiaceae bacterium]